MPLPAAQKKHNFYQFGAPASWTYNSATGSTDADKRRSLTAALKNARIMAVPEHINGRIISRTVGGNIPSQIPSYAIANGDVLLNAHYDGSTRTGVIRPNEPVVLDYTTGKNVTGINSTWKSDEYVIVGMALDGMLTTGTRKIAVRLQPPSSTSDPDTFLATPDVTYNPWPTLKKWLDKSMTWTVDNSETNKALIAATPTDWWPVRFFGSEARRWVRNVKQQYMLRLTPTSPNFLETQLIVHEVDDQLLTEYRMPSPFSGILMEDAVDLESYNVSAGAYGNEEFPAEFSFSNGTHVLHSGQPVLLNYSETARKVMIIGSTDCPQNPPPEEEEE